jgi:GST-like protein
VFESGAILIYLAEKTGRFMPKELRARIQVIEWVMWQMGGLGPMSGQAGHFSRYAPEKIPYAIDRYKRETERLYGVLDTRLADREFVAGDYSIADMASFPWIAGYEYQGIDIDSFPNLKRWHATIKARPAVTKGMALGRELRTGAAMDDEARRILFGQGGAKQ